jgi:hypothetical protein
MKTKIVTLFFFLFSLQQGRGQNWAPVPCYDGSAQITKMFVDSLHNKLIINCILGHTVCGVTYKGLVAYNGHQFHDLDFGLNKYDPNPSTSGDKTMDCIPFNEKTLFGGMFASVGSDTLYSEAMALWNGNVWDTFPKFTFTNNPGRHNSAPLINGFLRDNGRIWIYGAFKDLGGVPGYNIYTFDGNAFSSINIPISNFNYNYPINNMIKYKTHIYALGGFTNPPSYSISRLARYDGTSWTSVGNGIVGSIDNGFDMIVYKDTLYIAGSFSKASGNAGNYIMKWDGSQLHDAGFGGFNGWWAITKMLVYRNRLYTFGYFDQAAGQKAFGVAYYENGQWTVPQDSIAGNIYSAAIFNDAIYIAGNFLSIYGDPGMKHFARLLCPDFDAGSGCLSGIKEHHGQLSLKAFPNPSDGHISLEPESHLRLDNITIINTLGQEVLKLQEPGPRPEIDLSGQPAGIYLIKVQSSEGQRILKIIKE